MLEALGWPTLEQRRQTCRLLMLYKIQSGLAHCPSLKAKPVPLPSRQRHTHDKQFTLLTTRTQYRGSSFLPKTIRDWNLLPMEVVESPTLDAFGSRVSNWWTTYSNPPPPHQLHPSHLTHSDSFYAGPVLQRTPPVTGTRIINMLIVGP